MNELVATSAFNARVPERMNVRRLRSVAEVDRSVWLSHCEIVNLFISGIEDPTTIRAIASIYALKVDHLDRDPSNDDRQDSATRQ